MLIEKGNCMKRPFSERRILVIACLMMAWPATAQRSFDTDILRETFGFDDATPKSVELDQLRQGCPTRDCIPSIDNPRFVPASEASHVDDDDIVLALSWRGEYRAYPSRILAQHEIVNDVQRIVVEWLG